MKTEGVRKRWDKYKYVVLMILIGVGLLVWPSGKEPPAGDAAMVSKETVDVADVEREMEEILSVMSGVGQVRVMLTVDSDGERELAQDTELAYSGNTAAPEDYSRHSSVVLADGGSGDEALVTKTVYPTYRGALVVCQGGGQAEVQLVVTQAVAALTGLTTDRITVAKWQ